MNDFWDRWREPIEAALDQATQPRSGCPLRLAESVRYSLLAGGKRLRPLLVLMACDAAGGSPEDAMPAAVAVEMIHTYSLVHDDLPAMDDDDTRRGRPTNHVVYGEAMAILAGDGLLTLAFEHLATQIASPEKSAKCVAILARASGIAGMVGGQADDILGGLSEGDLESLVALHARKTGALLAASLLLGGCLAGADGETLDALECYGGHLGLTFQITDDLLDVTGTAASLGKTPGKDAAAGKLTFPGLLGLEASRERARHETHAAIAALAPLGPKAHRLEALAHYVLERDR